MAMAWYIAKKKGRYPHLFLRELYMNMTGSGKWQVCTHQCTPPPGRSIMQNYSLAPPQSCQVSVATCIGSWSGVWEIPSSNLARVCFSGKNFFPLSLPYSLSKSLQKILFTYAFIMCIDKRIWNSFIRNYCSLIDIRENIAPGVVQEEATRWGCGDQLVRIC